MTTNKNTKRLAPVFGSYGTRRGRIVGLHVLAGLVTLLTGAFLVQRAIADQDAAKIAAKFPSSAALRKQLAPLAKRLMALRDKVDDSQKPISAEVRKTLIILSAKVGILAEKEKIIDFIRIGKQPTDHYLTELTDGYLQLNRLAAAFRRTPTEAQAKRVIDAGTSLDLRLFANKGFVDVEGNVVDQSGKPLNGVKMTVIKVRWTGYRPLGGLLAPTGPVTKRSRTINGHFHVVATGFQQMLIKFAKPPLLPAAVNLGGGYGRGKADENKRDGVPGWRYFVKKQGKAWVFRIVLNPQPPKISLDDYDGQLSEGPNGRGDAITMSVPSTARRLQLKNVDLTKPKKLPPYTFYVTFKRDAKGRVLMKKFIQKSNGVAHEIPQEIVLHLTGKNAGLHITWNTVASEHDNNRYASKGPYQDRIVVTAKELLRQPDPQIVDFGIQIGGRYGYSSLSFSWQFSKKANVITLEQIELGIQSKNYHTRYIYPY